MLTMAYRMVFLLLHKPFSFSKSNYNALLLFRIWFFSLHKNNLNFIRIKLTLIFYWIICASGCSSLSIFIFVSFIQWVLFLLLRYFRFDFIMDHFCCRQTFSEWFWYDKFIAAINSDAIPLLLFCWRFFRTIIRNSNAHKNS